MFFYRSEFAKRSRFECERLGPLRSTSIAMMFCLVSCLHCASVYSQVILAARNPNFDEATDSLDSPPQSKVNQSLAGDGRAVDGRVVACQSAGCWPPARLMEQRAASLCMLASKGNDGQQYVASIQSNFLRRQAARQRDLAASAALKAYYSWIANAQQLDISAEAIRFQKEQIKVQESLIDRGVAIEDPTAVERSGLELSDSRLQLEASDRQFAQLLLQLTCCATDVRQASVESLVIQPNAPDCDRLRRVALECRQDYLAWLQLNNCLDARSALAISELITPLVEGVGSELLPLGWLERICLASRGEQALACVRRELRTAIDLQARLIEQNVCERCQALGTAYERVQIAEKILGTWDQRLAALNRLEELGDARGVEQVKAKSESLRARSTLVARRLSAKLAEVDLAEAVGDLAGRCCRGEPWLPK